MIEAYLQAAMMIFIAEMGDKTQILALTFATKYKLRHILIGVTVGAFLNHGLAILLGSLLSQFVPMDALQLVAAAMFIGFAFWSLKTEDEDDTTELAKYGPVVTVALAFFLGELGDKTQLTALTLGASSAYPFLVLLGTVTGMVLTSAMGIFVGAKLGKKIPEMQLKLGAFAVFMGFGLEKAFTNPYLKGLGPLGLSIGLILLTVVAALQIRTFVRHMKTLETTALAKRAEIYKQYMRKARHEVDQLCLGESVCFECRGNGCTVGFMKDLLDRAAAGEVIEPQEIQKINSLVEKAFNPVLTKSILMSLKQYYETYPEEYTENIMLKSLRAALERILFGELIESQKDFEHYKRILESKDHTFGLEQFN